MEGGESDTNVQGFIDNTSNSNRGSSRTLRAECNTNVGIDVRRLTPPLCANETEVVVVVVGVQFLE